MVATIPLCAPVVGLASVGHTICRTFEQSAENSMGQLIDKPNQLFQRIHQFKIKDDNIQQGYGEYIVFHQSENTSRSPNRETFEGAYEIFNDYLPATVMNRGPESRAMHDSINRYNIIRERIKSIDASLEVAFIPRTLYEMFLLRKCIQEDLKNKSICPFTDGNNFIKKAQDFKRTQGTYEEYLKTYEEYLKKCSEVRTKRKCWHLCFFDNADNYNNDSGVKEIAFRLNRKMVKTFSPTSGGFTYQKFVEFAENEITFFKTHFENGKKGNQKVFSINHINPTTNFGFEGGRIHYSMAVKDNNDQVIREAVALECSMAAHHCFFIYRGANFVADYSPCIKKGQERLRSLSYGSSLFAGSVFDPTATVFYYVKQTKDVYAIAIPFNQLHTSPFYIPPTNAIVQLFSIGEFFHARSKAWSDYDVLQLSGIFGEKNSDRRAHLKSKLSKDEFLDQLRCYMSESIHLQHPKCIKQTIKPVSKL